MKIMLGGKEERNKEKRSSRRSSACKVVFSLKILKYIISIASVNNAGNGWIQNSVGSIPLRILLHIIIYFGCVC
jgi:hypothetical protein